MKSTISFLDVIASQGSIRLKLIKLFDLWVGTLLSAVVPAKPQKTINPSHSIKSVLIIRPGGIGDAVFLLPHINALRRCYPEANITILAEQRNAQVFLSQPHLKLFILRYDHLSDFISVFRTKYDVVVDTEQWHYLSALTAYFTRSTFSIGFATRPLRKKLFNKTVEYDHNQYELFSFNDLWVDLLTKERLPTSLEDSFKVNQDAESPVAGDYVVLSLGASIPIRRLSVEQNCDIINKYLGRNIKVVLIGGKDVVGLGGAIATRIPSVLNLVGKISFLQLISLVKNCQELLAVDSGILHVAVALGVKTTGFFGPGNIKKWARESDIHRIVSLSYPCSPCTYFGYTIPRACHRSFACIKGMSLGRVMSK